MPGHDIIVIGASAGGIQALTEICRGLPEHLPAAVFVVVHVSPKSPGLLPPILNRAGPIPVEHPSDGQTIQSGRVYVAAPDRHLLIKHGRIRLSYGPKENGFRPAVDPLFRTAANTCGRRVVGVVLSGGLDDGTEGLSVIKARGGIAVVQDPNDAVFPSMPRHAIENVKVDHVLPAAQIPALLDRLARQHVRRYTMPRKNGPDIAESGDQGLLKNDMGGSATGLICPECGGTLWERRGNGRAKRVKFRCHLGHGYTGDGLAEAQGEEVEAALWSAVRSLEENAALRRRLAKRAPTGIWTVISQQYEKQAEESEKRAATIRSLLLPNIEDGQSKRPRPRKKKRRAARAGDR